MSAITLAVRLFIAAHCMAALGTRLQAQEVVLQAPAIEAVWTGADGVVRAQAGWRIAHLTSPPSFSALPGDAVAFDHGPALAVATRDALQVPGVDGRAVGCDLPFALPGAGGAPLRAPLFLTDGVVAAPGASGVTLVDRSTGAATPIGAEPRRSRRRGFGLTGEIVDDLVVPRVLGFEHAGVLHVLVGDHGAWSLRRGTTSTPLADVAIDENARIEEFEHVVPPLLADVDHDGVPDLVRVDPRAGTIAIHSALHAATPPPPRVIVLKAPILAIDAADMTGDGKADLLVLRLPPLTPLQQLEIVMASKLPATLLVYDLAVGRAAAPVTTREIDVGVDIVVKDDLRRAEVRDLVTFGSGKVLVATPGRRARLYPLSGDDPVELGQVPAGAWVDPLRAVRARDGVYGVLIAPDGARLVRTMITP